MTTFPKFFGVEIHIVTVRGRMSHCYNYLQKPKGNGSLVIDRPSTMRKAYKSDKNCRLICQNTKINGPIYAKNNTEREIFRHTKSLKTTE